MSKIIGQSSSSQQSILSILGKQLLKAAEDGDDKQVQSLLLQGASFTANWLGMSPLHYACMNGHLECARILTRAGASVDGRTKVDKTAMHFAAQFGHHDVVAMLITMGADVNVRDMLEMTPLHWAVVEQNLEMAKLLIDNNAEISTRNKFDKSPMNSAEELCDYRMIEYLKGYTSADDMYRGNTPTTSQESSSENTSFQGTNLVDQLSWLQQELANNAAGGTPVLLEGANTITLSEGGKLAWAQVFEQDRPSKENEKNLEIVLPTPVQENGQKVLSFKVPQHVLSTATTNSTLNEQALTILLSPGKTKALKPPVTKRRKAFPQSRDQLAANFVVAKEDALQLQLAAAQNEVEIYREKLLRKEQEANLWKEQLERLQQARR